MGLTNMCSSTYKCAQGVCVCVVLTRRNGICRVIRGWKPRITLFPSLFTSKVRHFSVLSVFNGNLAYISYL